MTAASAGQWAREHLGVSVELAGGICRVVGVRAGQAFLVDEQGRLRTIGVLALCRRYVGENYQRENGGRDE